MTKIITALVAAVAGVGSIVYYGIGYELAAANAMKAEKIAAAAAWEVSAWKEHSSFLKMWDTHSEVDRRFVEWYCFNSNAHNHEDGRHSHPRVL